MISFIFQEPNSSHERLDSEEYVRILNDVIHVNKNLCVARYFNHLDKDLPRFVINNFLKIMFGSSESVVSH